MMLPVVLVSVLAGSSAPADPPPAAMAPAPAELAPAPAPAPAELAPAPASAPSTVTVEVTTTTPSSTTVVVEEWPSSPPPAPVVVVTPAPAAPTLSPPAPTWGPVQTPAYVPPTEESIRQTMRQHRRGAVGAFVVGGLGMGAALGFQYLRIRAIERCAARGEAAPLECFDADGMQLPFGYYSTLGMGMFVAGTAGAGVMLGNAAATRDVQLRGGQARSRTGLKVLGVAVIGAATAWMVGANMQLVRHESQCNGDPSCVLRYRPLRFAANDGAAVGIAAGAGMIGYAVGYERQGKALARLRAAPSLSARHGGVSLAIEF